MDIESHAYHHLKKSGCWYVFPQLSYLSWRADMIGVNNKGKIIEVEIKRTWADYKQDYVKFHEAMGNSKRRRLQRKNNLVTWKHDWLNGCYPCMWRPTHFVFCAPMDLATRILDDPALPKKYGVWGLVEKPGRRDNIAKLRRMTKLIKFKPEWKPFLERDITTRAMRILDSDYERCLKNQEA